VLLIPTSGRRFFARVFVFRRGTSPIPRRHAAARRFRLAGGTIPLAVVVGRPALARVVTAGDMVRPVRIYMVVIGVMATLACGVTAAGGPWAVVVGALAFTASDKLLPATASCAPRS
jgi:uncharacterized membrane protein YhhN